MSKIVEEITERGRLCGREEGIQEGIQFMVFRMLDIGKMSTEEIAEYTGLSIEEIKALTEKVPE